MRRGRGKLRAREDSEADLLRDEREAYCVVRNGAERSELEREGAKEA